MFNEQVIINSSSELKIENTFLKKMDRHFRSVQERGHVTIINNNALLVQQKEVVQSRKENVRKEKM